MSSTLIQIQPAGSVRIETAVRKLHVSLNVSDLKRSLAFYQELFGIPPAKSYDDYAKFEVAEPPVVLSLVPRAPVHGGNLNHAGLRMTGPEELVEVQRRLEKAGFATRREDGVECCYALQTKFWVTDPDQVLWEIYVLHDDIEHHGHGRAKADDVDPAVADPATNVVWEHRIGSPLTARIPHDDDSVHEVRLEGTINLKPQSGRMDALMAEAARVLRPGAILRIHGLAADVALTGPLPQLPGPAAVVEHVPAASEIGKMLEAAGFVDVRFEKLSPKPYFTIGGVPLREMTVAGRRPGLRPDTRTHNAVFLGPQVSITDDFGNVFRRGEFTAVNVHDWQMLSKGPIASRFLLLAPEGAQADPGSL